jgi:broad specificity phosphatase PhoE
LTRRILLIRHGETTWNSEKRCQGFTDVPLSDTGVNQARLLSRVLMTERLEAVYSSDLIRARTTADIIAEPHNIQVQTDVRLREMNQGRLEGKTLQEMLKEFPGVLKEWVSNPAEMVMPGGESLKLLQDRGWHAFCEILERHPGQNIAVVAHNLLNTCILCKILDLHLNNFRKIKQLSCALNEIEQGPHGFVVFRLNDTHHLG